MNVLILGATSDVASEVARIYAGRGARLYLVGRNEARLLELSTSLGSSCLGYDAVDFTDFPVSLGVLEGALAALGPLDVALLAQGYLGDQLKSEESFPEALEQIQVNLTSAVAQLIPLANYFEQQGRGTIAAITSVAGDRGRPRNYTYGAAKGALTLYLQGLRSRLFGKVNVVTIKLGPVDTRMTTYHKKNALFTTIEGAALGIVRAIDRKSGEVYVPGYWFWIMSLVKIMPELVFQRLRALSGR